MLRVDLRKWVRKNWSYMVSWISMGLVMVILLARKMGFELLVLIGPFLPYLVICLIRMRRELKK
ncbi:MAG: hypothetical protein QXG10_00825 [Candidatus Hadarchaeales archaeon]